jgi:hypothetical protein
LIGGILCNSNAGLRLSPQLTAKVASGLSIFATGIFVNYDNHKASALEGKAMHFFNHGTRRGLVVQLMQEICPAI